jgi:hypothetical protein
LRVDNVRHVDKLVIPGKQRNDFARIVLEQIRNLAACHRRNDFLALRGEGNDAVVDRVAAGLLIIGDDLFECGILFLDEALRPPDGRGRSRRVGDVGPHQGSSGCEP